MPTTNRFLSALKENANIVGLSSAVALSLAILNPLPLLVGVVAEAAYLVFVPDSKWYDARLSRRYDAEVVKRRQQLKEHVLPLCRAQMQERFRRLEETRRQIDAQPVEDQKWFREVLRKLDYLLEKFLLFAEKEAQFRSYLRSLGEQRPAEDRETGRPRRRGDRGDGATEARDWSLRPVAPSPESPRRPPVPPSLARGGEPAFDPEDRWVQQMVHDVQAEYQGDIESLRELIEKEDDASTKAVLEKRQDVLQRRFDFVGKIGKILTNLNHQLQLLEDTFGLINDEMRARSPEQVLSDIEDVVWQTDSMTKLLEEVGPFEQMIARMER